MEQAWSCILCSILTTHELRKNQQLCGTSKTFVHSIIKENQLSWNNFDKWTNQKKEKIYIIFNSWTDAFLRKELSRLYDTLHWGVNDNCYELNSIELDAKKKEVNKKRNKKIKNTKVGSQI